MCVCAHIFLPCHSIVYTGNAVSLLEVAKIGCLDSLVVETLSNVKTGAILHALTTELLSVRTAFKVQLSKLQSSTEKLIRLHAVVCELNTQTFILQHHLTKACIPVNIKQLRIKSVSPLLS